MSRYIDADLLLSTLNENKIPYDSDINYFICHAPTADVRENVKGEWIKHPEKKNIYGGKIVECSNCHTQYVVRYIEDELFCRNCGARMVEE